MATADILSSVIMILGTIACVVFIILAIKCKIPRALYIIIAFGCAGLAFVFALNSFHVVTNASGLTGGRPWTIIILAGVMGLGLYTLRNQRKGC
jgi:hypothetical protein